MASTQRYLPLLFCLTLLSCSSDDNAFQEIPLMGCGVNNPLEELDWLRSEVEKRKNDSSEAARYCYISQFEQNGITYFLYEDCDPLVDKVILVYNCAGGNIGFIGDDNFPFQIFMERKVIFYPKNTLCNFSN